MIARHSGLKLIAFLAVAIFVSAVLVVVVGDLRFVPSDTYRAEFSSASGMRTGDDVKVAGVPVGKVESIEFARDGLVEVGFSLDREVELLQGATLAIRYKNLIGDRYLEITNRSDGTGRRATGDPIPVSQTEPALDIDSLVNGFKPLLQGLDPDEANRLSVSLIEVLNGRQQSIAAFIQQVGSLGNTLADRDRVIGDTIRNLDLALAAVTATGDKFDRVIVDLQSLISGLDGDRATITTGLDQIQAGTDEVSQLLVDNRPAITGDIDGLRRLATNLNADSDTLSLLLGKLPTVYPLITRIGSYGSFVNWFVCGLAIRYPAIGGGHQDTPMFVAPAERCTDR